MAPLQRTQLTGTRASRESQGSAPEPPQNVRQNGTSMFVGMRAIRPLVVHVVTRTRHVLGVRGGVRVRERREHLLVREKAVAVLVVQVVRAILQKDADRLDGIFADECGV